jgi:hypothetical protein
MTTHARIAARLSLAALLMAVPAAASSQAAQSPLKIVGPAKLTLDPRCNARSGMQFLTQLRNDTAASVPLALTVAEPVAKTGGKLALLKVAILTVDADGKPVAKAALGKDESATVRLDLAGTLYSGDWEIELRNAGAVVGKITVASPPAVIGVKLDAPDNAEIVLERGRPATIAVKNEDSYGHRLSAQLTIRGVALNAQHEISLTALGGGEFTFKPAEEWFTGGVIGWLLSLFKDEAAEARLTLRSFSPACLEDPATPTQLFKMKATLAARPVATRDFRWNTILIVTLVLGGVFSLGLNFLLPAHARRFRVRNQLSLVAAQIGQLPGYIDVRVRASIGVEHRQLTDRLGRLKFYDGQFSIEMTEIERGLARLQTRLELLGEIDLVVNRFWKQRAAGLPFLVSEEIDEVKGNLDDMLRRPSLGDSEVQMVRALVKGIDDRLRNMNQPDGGLAARLAEKIDDLHADFVAQGQIGSSPVWQELSKDLVEKFDEITAAKPPTDPGKIAPKDYVRLSRVVFILEQARAFILLCRAGGAGGMLKPEDLKRRGVLLQSLRGGGYEQMRRARRLVRQMKEGIFHQQVEQEIADRRVEIVYPSVVRQFHTVELRAVFDNKEVQNSAVREEYTCHWKFGHGEHKATGWSVSHFFPFATDREPQPTNPDQNWMQKLWHRLTSEKGAVRKPHGYMAGRYKVSVKFVRDDGHKVPTEADAEITVLPPQRVKVRASAWMEGLRFSLALGIAIAGLILGAREQVLKMDAFPALITVFLLGFGSDRIKNMFGQKAAEEAKPAPAASPAARQPT